MSGLMKRRGKVVCDMAGARAKLKLVRDAVLSWYRTFLEEYVYVQDCTARYQTICRKWGTVNKTGTPVANICDPDKHIGC